MSVDRIAVLGAGSWGTTYAAVIADAGFPVTLWARRPEVAEEINTAHTNERYLGKRVLPELLVATDDDIAAVTDAEVIVLAVPAQTLRENLGRWKAQLSPEVRLVSLMKGIEVDTGKRMSEVIAEVAEVDPAQIAVVSGPNLAREIADQQPTATVVAAESIETAEVVAEISANSYFRPYTNTDVIGVEMGGAVKNVIALAVGIADGQKLGDNSKASIITRGLAETSRLAAAMGAEAHTLSGLAGLGDLVATCASPLSRNRTFGRHLGEGMSLEETIAHTSQTAEGVKSSPAVLALGRRYGVDLPITEAVCAVLAGKLRVDELSGLLLSRKRKHEGPPA
ncbi:MULTISPECIES: NAD(P)H-dependent glycerol-3-phosphate dehydrogenase [unclassified Brevibacterium]|uniref:NAD(P)H-dependent glycerol-3-phosphate dehydrogenase n=1 Tax=unclassified Brevibacterium TaxID=2614124 RepID=UPI001E4D1001|nr:MULTISPECIES: NAD(P)H-dependent glycerol-3-phosphate dehydrogenase [unclassified Brevibacterium]MCD1285873.1 glycerol-3-phosphate dehydrogenase [Brevibacterium sp. CCUG 69071]MDK8434935.1 NAD(P)H-dependent glycerol-3-phosphate dehydrogenase [Brevibacterium sp. H-BE7]